MTIPTMLINTIKMRKWLSITSIGMAGEEGQDVKKEEDAFTGRNQSEKKL